MGLFGDVDGAKFTSAEDEQKLRDLQRQKETNPTVEDSWWSKFANVGGSKAAYEEGQAYLRDRANQNYTNEWDPQAYDRALQGYGQYGQRLGTAYDQYHQAAMGNAPSQAEILGRKSMDTAQSNMLSTARSGNPRMSGANTYAALQGGAKMQQGVTGDIMAQRASEMERARAGLLGAAGEYGNYSKQGMDLMGMRDKRTSEDANSHFRNRGVNAGYDAAMFGREGQQTGLYNREQDRRLGLAAASDAASSQGTSSALSAVGTAAAIGVMASGIDTKEQVVPADAVAAPQNQSPQDKMKILQLSGLLGSQLGGMSSVHAKTGLAPADAGVAGSIAGDAINGEDFKGAGNAAKSLEKVSGDLDQKQYLKALGAKDDPNPWAGAMGGGKMSKDGLVRENPFAPRQELKMDIERRDPYVERPLSNTDRMLAQMQVEKANVLRDLEGQRADPTPIQRAVKTMNAAASSAPVRMKPKGAPAPAAPGGAPPPQPETGYNRIIRKGDPDYQEPSLNDYALVDFMPPDPQIVAQTGGGSNSSKETKKNIADAAYEKGVQAATNVKNNAVALGNNKAMQMVPALMSAGGIPMAALMAQKLYGNNAPAQTIGAHDDTDTAYRPAQEGASMQYPGHLTVSQNPSVLEKNIDRATPSAPSPPPGEDAAAPTKAGARNMISRLIGPMPWLASSDDSKENKSAANSPIRDFEEKAKGFTYDYKSPGFHPDVADPNARFLGPIAENLNKVKGGINKSLTFRDKRTGLLGVNTGRLSLANAAAVSDLNNRIERLEG
jgi:hypothetical protein